jgi:very-short-patch-repair endonuclease
LDRTTNRIRGTTPEIEADARRLRKNLTPAEQILWQALKGKQLNGLRFRCQHPVGLFIIDFFCPQSKLVVELDGEVHNEQMEYDTARTEQFKAYSYRVLRFRNEEVLDNLPSVLERIFCAVSSSPQHGILPP